MNKNPDHIAIILDGNRRFAKKHLLKPGQGHEKGVNNVKNILKWSRELGIKELTLYCFSVENFNRNEEEVKLLMSLFKKEFSNLKKDEGIQKDRVKVNFIGRIELFDEELKKDMKEIMEKTSSYDNFIVNFALAYGSKTEITDAAKKIASDVKDNKLDINDIDEEKFSDYLYMKDSPDLLIRTSGEIRISNFLLWQCSYSELYFTDKLWPEFSKEDLIDAIEEYKNRERRYGV